MFLTEPSFPSIQNPSKQALQRPPQSHFACERDDQEQQRQRKHRHHCQIHGHLHDTTRDWGLSDTTNSRYTHAGNRILKS
jgi:hypothetical protein